MKLNDHPAVKKLIIWKQDFNLVFSYNLFMKLLVDTVNEDFYMALIKDEKTLFYTHKKNYKKKSDIVPVVFKKLINSAKIVAKDIDEIYVVNGPGSFMGIRAGMTFCKTMALITGAKLFGTDNLSFISRKRDGEYFVDAKGGKSYRGLVSNNIVAIDLVDYKENSPIDYESIIMFPLSYTSIFQEIEDIPEYKCNYVKEPQIGGA